MVRIAGEVTTMGKLAACGIAWIFLLAGIARANEMSKFLDWVPTPPMGWNSWDCYGTTVTEQQTRANADYMAAHLAGHGWQYIVVDIQWYEPDAKGWEYRPNAKLVMDQFGRLLPAPNRFPSAAGGKGFKPLADYVHSKGLKFGVHILRGIPREAVARNLPIYGSTAHAADVADKTSTCKWNPDMYGVDMSKPGSQEYYNSIFSQFAEWGVDFVKVDDLSRPYHKDEIHAIRKAIDNSGRPMIFSTSPGPTPLDQAADISANANLWRISDDLWDQWPLLKDQFQRCADWARYSGEGHYPDADMLPLGAILVSRNPGTTGPTTHFSHDEQCTLMTLWSICRSPLIFGGDLARMDPFTLSLLTNNEVLAVDQHSSGGRELFRTDDLIAWTAYVAGSDDRYLAVFNAAEGDPTAISVSLNQLGFTGQCKVRDLWKRKDIGAVYEEFAPVIPSHGAGLYRLSPTQH
jgi:alpha-galactosidase